MSGELKSQEPQKVDLMKTAEHAPVIMSSLLTSVASNKVEMPDARVSLTRWYNSLSLEEKEKLKPLAAQYGRRLSTIAEGLAQELIILINS